MIDASDMNRCWRFGAIGTAVLAISLTANAQCDPLEQARLFPDTMAFERFGESVAISGDVAVVGSEATNTVHVFRLIDDRWTRVQRLTAADGEPPYDYFGRSVSIDGHTLIVGAPGDDDRNEDAGAVYFFRDRGEGRFRQIAKVAAPDGRERDHFGSVVAISGDHAIVGAPDDDRQGSDFGSAYILRDVGNGQWVPVGKLGAADGVPEQHFGSAVAISASAAIVGTRPVGEGHLAQVAYIYRDQGQGIWTQVARLAAPDPSREKAFARSVSISGSLALVGAPGDDENGSHSGAAYAFEENQQGQWELAAKLMPADADVSDRFGTALAMAGHLAVIGAPDDDDQGDNSGSAYAFRRDANAQWVESGKLLPSDGQRMVEFGHTVAASGQFAIIGLFTDSGIWPRPAYVFDLNCDPILRVVGTCPGPVEFRVENVTPGERIAYLVARGIGSQRVPVGNPCEGTRLGLNQTTRLAGVVRASGNGVANLGVNVPAFACGQIYVQAIDLGSCATTNVALIE